MSRVGVVLRKELRDALRDRRSLLSLLLFPLIGPVLVSFMLTELVERATREPPVELPVAGRQHAPGLTASLARRGIKVVDAPADVEMSIATRKADVVLVVSPDYGRAFREGRPATLTLVYDDARERSHGAIRRTRAALQEHAATVGALRLLARGVAADLAQPITIDEVDLSTPARRAASFLNLIPMFVLLAAFMGGMYAATDSTAGERERGSLEPLLITPVRRRTLVLGKWLAAVVFSAATVVLTLAATLAGLSRVPLGRFGMSLAIVPADVALLLVAVLPLTLLVTALQMLVASFARTFKEAQTYLSLMVLLPMVPALATSFAPLSTERWMMLVPVLAQQLAMSDILAGTPPNAASLLLAALSTAATGAVAIVATAWLFRRERIIYGR